MKEMFCVNTTNGVFVVREHEVASTTAAKKLWEVLPKDRISHCDNEVEVREVLACLRGEWYYPPAVFLGDLFRSCRADNMPAVLTYSPEDEMVGLTCTDGHLKYPARALRDRFQMVEDFLTEHPEADTIALPFTQLELLLCLYPVRSNRLVACYDALCHLNPKCGLYPFYYSMRDIEPHKILEVAGRVSVEESRRLAQYAARAQVELPCVEGIHTLAAMGSVIRSETAMESLYRPRYPSYAISRLLSEVVSPQWMLQALRTWDFTPDMNEPVYDACQLHTTLFGLLSRFNLTEKDLPMLPYGMAPYDQSALNSADW